ncbi:MAG: DUF6713 family protein [Alphaproteobacteria bacterium]
MLDRFGWPLFCLALALLATHELDAMIRHEWRLLPVLSGMDDKAAMQAFILLHIPMFGVMYWMGGHGNAKARRRNQLILDAIMVGHAIAHFLLNDHPKYEFVPPVETITVFGAGLVAAIHMWLLVRQPASSPKRD